MRIRFKLISFFVQIIASVCLSLVRYTSEEILPVDTESAVLSAKLKTLITDVIHMIQVKKQPPFFHAHSPIDLT